MTDTSAFQGSIVIVTGASTGKGWAAARDFAGAGPCVVLADLESDGLRDAAARLRDAGRDAVATVCDDEADVQQLVVSTVERSDGSTSPTTTQASSPPARRPRRWTSARSIRCSR